MLKNTPKCPKASMKYSTQLDSSKTFPFPNDQLQNQGDGTSKPISKGTDPSGKRSKMQDSLYSSDRFGRRSDIQLQSTEKPDSKAEVQKLVAMLKQQYSQKSQEGRFSNLSRLTRQNSYKKMDLTPEKPEKRNNVSFIELQEKIAQYSHNTSLISAKSEQKFIEMNKSPDRNAILNQKSEKCRQLCEEIKRKLFKETVSTTSTDSHKKGLSITDFRLEKLIGQGKFSKVYIARHKKTGFLLAIKIIKKQTIKRQKFVEQLIRQIKIQSFLNHVNLVKLYSFFQDKLNFYLLLEYCAGGQLYNIFKVKSKLKEEEWQPIMKGICEGLYEMHRNCVIHRDLKPENIVMCFGLPKIADFGWSVYTQDKRETFCGTPLYISPELLLGNSYDNEVDIWALGVMMYQFLTGKIPFKIQHQKNLLDIVNSQVTYPKTLGKESAELLKMILQKDPSCRIGILDILEHPFLNNKLQSSTDNFFKISR